jgi:hypothetical protein
VLNGVNKSMPSKFSKKNSDYSRNERLTTGIISFIIFSLLAFFYTKSLSIEGDYIKMIIPYLIGFISGILVGLFGYRYPKVIHLTVFVIPLMFAGS